MPSTTATVSRGKPRASRVILSGGLLAGVLDLAAAFVMNVLAGREPVGVLFAIASGLLGAAAFDGGFAVAALGTVLHFVIASGATAVYYAASRRLNLLVDRAWICGPIYGVAVYLVMHLVVLPLSAVPFTPVFTIEAVATGLAIHMVLVGLPISLTVRWFSR